MYHELVQVPLVVVPPSPWALPPRQVSTQVRLIDLAPTLLETAGVDGPAFMAGASLVSLLQEEGPVPDRPAYSEREHLGTPSAALRQDGYTLIVYTKGQPPELYDLREDPGETRNLAGQLPDRVDLLETRLRELAEELDRQAASLGVRAEDEELDPELLEQLRSLGYVGG
jgi:arylsulfatase A-like enzyme